MRRNLVAAALVALVVAVPVAFGAGSSAQRALVSRWHVKAHVLNGYQHLSRISDSSSPGHKGQGTLDSAWVADWRIKLKQVGPDVYIVGANAFQVTGSAKGEYRGSYPKTQTETAHFTCRFHASDNKLLKKLHIYGVGRIDAPVHAFIGIVSEPGVLPPLKCTGDLIDRGTPNSISGGVLTGIESACFGQVSFPGKKLKARKPFRVKKHFGWDPPSPAGASRSCTGFGAPIRSSGSGTIRLEFEPVQ